MTATAAAELIRLSYSNSISDSWLVLVNLDCKWHNDYASVISTYEIGKVNIIEHQIKGARSNGDKELRKS